jgi:hypothetical protein
VRTISTGDAQQSNKAAVPKEYNKKIKNKGKPDFLFEKIETKNV